MDNELLDIFTYKLLSDIPLIQEDITALKMNKSKAVANLFRYFHNYKASSSYLELDPIHQLASQAENILSSLRQTKEEVHDKDSVWLQTCLNQLQVWCDELMVSQDLSPINSNLFPNISILDESKKTSEIMKTLSLVYVNDKVHEHQKMQAALKQVFKEVHCTHTLENIKVQLLTNKVDIFIINMHENSIKIAQQLLTLKPDIALITAVPQLKTLQKSRLILKGMTHTIASPIKAVDLKRQLHNIITSHFSKVYTLVSHETIYNFIQRLDPLPSSIKKIAELCDDEESSIKDIIKAVESDPISTASILHAANMPIYGVKRTSSIETAVVAFGKRLIKALTFSDLSCKIGELELKAYDINEEQFKRTSQLRLMLMEHWYSRVDASLLPLLSSSALLGNLGQILINEEIINKDLVADFKTLITKDLVRAEVSLLKTSASFVTADILEHWDLDPDLVDSIRYSDSPFNSSTIKIQKLACANAVVYSMVSPYGELQEEVPKQTKILMEKAGLKISSLQEAVNTLLK